MTHLEHVDVTQGTALDERGDHLALGVAGEQGRHGRSARRLRHVARVSGRISGSRARRRISPGSKHDDRVDVLVSGNRAFRPQDRKGQVTRPQHVSRADLPHLGMQALLHHAHKVGRFLHKLVPDPLRKDHAVDAHMTHELGQAARMIEVGMGDDDRVELPDMLAGKGGEHRVVGPRVDQNGSPARLQQDGIALPDIEHDHPLHGPDNNHREGGCGNSRHQDKRPPGHPRAGTWPHGVGKRRRNEAGRPERGRPQLDNGCNRPQACQAIRCMADNARQRLINPKNRRGERGRPRGEHTPHKTRQQHDAHQRDKHDVCQRR